MSEPLVPAPRGTLGPVHPSGVMCCPEGVRTLRKYGAWYLVVENLLYKTDEPVLWCPFCGKRLP